MGCRARRAASRRRRPQAAGRPARERLVRRARCADAGRRGDRHQRQDILRQWLGRRCPGRASRRWWSARWASASIATAWPAISARPATPRPTPCCCSARLAQAAQQRRARAGDRGVVDRPRPGPAQRPACRRRAVYQFHPRPSRLPRRHGGLRGGQAPAVRLARPAPRGDQPRRRDGPAPGGPPAQSSAGGRHHRLQHRRRQRPATSPVLRASDIRSSNSGTVFQLEHAAGRNPGAHATCRPLQCQ